MLLLTSAPRNTPAQAEHESQFTTQGGNTLSLLLPEEAVTSGMVVCRDARTISYTAHAGVLAVGGTDADDLEIPTSGSMDRVVAPPDSGAIATMSYVAYFAKNSDGRERPLVFLYDGGPSISTRTMLVASFGPIMVDLPALGHLGGAPYTFRSNVDSLLDVADLVFIDPPGTGYGRIRGRDAAHTFYGIDGDAAAFDRFIRRFLTKYSRWESPKYLFGHSYGTTRNAVLARRLAEDGVDLNGIINVGMLLNLDDFPDAASGTPGTDNAYILQLSTFAATAWFHHKVAGQPGDLGAWLRTVEQFATGPYATALLAGSELPQVDEQRIARQLGEFTGLPAEVWIRTHLRLQASEFESILLSDKGLVVGRQDTRYTAPALHPLSTAPGFDASGVKGAAVQAVVDTYMHGTLKFGSGTNYQQDADIPGHWDLFHVSDESKSWLGTWNVLPDLAIAMTHNPNLRVLTMGGYFDLATPYLAGVYQMRHLPIARELDKNLSYAVFASGHEPYLDSTSRRRMHDDISNFILGVSSDP